MPVWALSRPDQKVDNLPVVRVLQRLPSHSFLAVEGLLVLEHHLPNSTTQNGSYQDFKCGLVAIAGVAAQTGQMQECNAHFALGVTCLACRSKPGARLAPTWIKCCCRSSFARLIKSCSRLFCSTSSKPKISRTFPMCRKKGNGGGTRGKARKAQQQSANNLEHNLQQMVLSLHCSHSSRPKHQ